MSMGPSLSCVTWLLSGPSSILVVGGIWFIFHLLVLAWPCWHASVTSIPPSGWLNIYGMNLLWKDNKPSSSTPVCACFCACVSKQLRQWLPGVEHRRAVGLKLCELLSWTLPTGWTWWWVTGWVVSWTNSGRVPHAVCVAAYLIPQF